MSLKAIWADRNPYSKFLLLVGIVLMSSGVLITLGFFLIKPVFGVDLILDPQALERLDDPSVIGAIKFLQVLQTVSAFIIPAFLMAYLLSLSAPAFLGIDKRPKGVSALLTIAATLSAVPFINWLGSINQLAELPSWMKDMEEKAMEYTKVFLTMDGPGDLLFSLFLVALLPAIGEELLFRGVVQRLFGDWIRNIHVAVILTAIVFSAIHMQFYGFLPRAVLGMFLGYLFVWTGSLWIPVLAHFTNNGMAVILEYFNQREALPFNPDTLGTTSDDIPVVLISIMLLSLFSYLIIRTGRERTSVDL